MLDKKYVQSIEPFFDDETFQSFYGRFLYKEYYTISVPYEKTMYLTTIDNKPFHVISCEGICFMEKISTVSLPVKTPSGKKIYQYLLKPLTKTSFLVHFSNILETLTLEGIAKYCEFYNKLLIQIEDKIETSIQEFTDNHFMYISEDEYTKWFNDIADYVAKNPKTPRLSALILPKMNYQEKDTIIKKWMNKLFKKD